MQPLDDPLGAFCRHDPVTIPGAPEGPLKGLTFTVKDVMSIAGTRCCLGSPRWLETCATAESTAPVVQSLLSAGATLIGRTIPDEFCYSLNGDNVHYGTPINPRAPERVPGGSSSGAASALAGGIGDFAIATDSGGSIRVPASFCGVFGIRPTHGRVSTEGVVPLAPSFDCVGWLARDPKILVSVGQVLLTPERPSHLFQKLLIGVDAFEACDPDTRRLLHEDVAELRNLLPTCEEVTLAPEGLEAWRIGYRIASAAEIWHTLGEWLMREEPQMGDAIRERFEFARGVTVSQRREGGHIRSSASARIRELLGSNAVLCVPSTPGPAPLRESKGPEIEDFRQRLQRLTCIAGFAGLPQINVPSAVEVGPPVGLSLIGPRFSDEALVNLAKRFVDCVGSDAA